MSIEMGGPYQWYLTPKREALIKALKDCPDYAGKNLSDLLEMAAEEFVKAHGKGNPQFKLEQFRDHSFVAFPTLGQKPPDIEALAETYDEKDLSTLRDNAEKWLHASRLAGEVRAGRVQFIEEGPVTEVSKPTGPVLGNVKRSPRCPFCNRPMFYGREAHEYSHAECKAAFAKQEAERK